MKRKLLIFFLAIISSVCICVGFSACDLLDSFINATQDSEQTQSDSDSDINDADQDESDDNTEQDASGGSSDSDDESGDGSEQSSSGDDTDQDTSDGDTDQDESDGNSDSDDESSDGSDQSPSDDNTDQDASGGSSDSDDESGKTTTDFTVRDGNSTYGYYQLANETNGEDMQSLYYQMYTVCEEFTTNTSDITATNGNYTISEISYSGYSLTSSQAVSVWKVFYYDNPMYYWLSNSCIYTGSTIYLCIDEAYASYSVRVSYDQAISTMIAEASALVTQNSSELEKAMAIHDYIIGKINYAYQSDGTTPETAIWAHNITGVSSKGYGVCEAYSKTYLALCLINGLDCVIVTGDANGEDHAWNLVKIDGLWYGVDCTWDDTGDDSDLSFIYFGMNESTTNSTRTADSQTYGMDYLYELPEIAEYSIQPVTLFKGNTEMGMYKNIDDAFAAMTSSSADYTIELYFYNYANEKVEISTSTTVYIYSNTTPAVNSITINGIYTDLGNGYFYISYLNIQNKLTLYCNLEVSNFILTATELDLGEYTLTTSGNYCQLNGTIYDNKTTGTVSIKSTISYQTVINAALDISYYYGGATINGTASIGTYYGSDMLSVYGTVTIDKYISANETSYYNIYLQEGANLNVNNLVYDSGSTKTIYIILMFNSLSKYPSLYLGNVDAKTNLYISGNISSSVAATPSNLDCAIATLGSSGDFTNIKIYFDNVNKTSLYSVNESGEIVYS